MLTRKCLNCSAKYSVVRERCPDCGAHAPRVAQPDSGRNYVDVDSKHGKHRSYFVPGGTCEWQAGRDRCQYPASVSDSTDGSGPFYCTAHHGCTDPSLGAQIVTASREASPPASSKLQAQAAAFCAERGLKTQADMMAYIRAHRPEIGKRPRNVEWAEKILARAAAGESLPFISLEKARSALQRQREPGE